MAATKKKNDYVVRLTLRTVDVCFVGRQHVGVEVNAVCKKKPQRHMMELAVRDVMNMFEGELENGETAPRECGAHDVDVDITPCWRTEHLNIQGPNTFTKVIPTDFQDKLLKGLHEGEWWESLKTGECKCELTMEFDE